MTTENQTPTAQSGPSADYGYAEGDVCRRNGCKGSIETHPAENCSCHISPPCSSCTSPRNFCNACDWHEKDDQVFNDYVVNVNPETGNYRVWTQRPLDNTKIDYRNETHTHFSMVKAGVYPEGTTRAEVEKEVRGTFGGRFDSFGNGRFRYVAYTD